jgi:hypothetical protein
VRTPAKRPIHRREEDVGISTQRIRLATGLVTMCVLAGVTASAAAAAGPQAHARTAATPDVFERYAAAHPYGRASVPDAFERYANAHPYGPNAVQGARTSPAPADRIVDDSFRDPPSVATPVGDRIVDDSFRDQPTVIGVQSTGSGFDWGDWAIGLLAGLAIASGLAGVLLLVSHRTRKSGVAAVG